MRAQTHHEQAITARDEAQKRVDMSESELVVLNNVAGDMITTAIKELQADYTPVPESRRDSGFGADASSPAASLILSRRQAALQALEQNMQESAIEGVEVVKMKISEQVSAKINALEEARKDLSQKVDEVNVANARVRRLKKAIRLRRLWRMSARREEMRWRMICRN